MLFHFRLASQTDTYLKNLRELYSFSVPDHSETFLLQVYRKSSNHRELQ